MHIIRWNAPMLCSTLQGWPGVYKAVEHPLMLIRHISCRAQKMSIRGTWQMTHAHNDIPVRAAGASIQARNVHV